MKRFLSLILTIVILLSVLSANASGFGDYLDGLIDAATSDDPELNSALKDLGGMYEEAAGLASGGQSGSDEGTPPVIAGPYSGNIVQVKVNNKTFRIHQSFKDAMDASEGFYDKYIEAMSSLDYNDTQSVPKVIEMLRKLTQYQAAIEELETQEKHLTKRSMKLRGMGSLRGRV